MSTGALENKPQEKSGRAIAINQPLPLRGPCPFNTYIVYIYKVQLLYNYRQLHKTRQHICKTHFDKIYFIK